MALWQYNFFVLPHDSFQDISNIKKLEKDDDNCFDDSLFWKKNPVSCDFFKEVGNILPKTKSWHKDLIMYGDINSNSMEILCSRNDVVSVSFRIDFTSYYDAILVQLIKFFIKNKLIILDENLNIVPLDLDTIKSIITKSPQVAKYNILSDNDE